MKKILLITTLIIAAGINAAAQSPTQSEALEQEIRRLEIAAADAVLRKDSDALDRLYAKDFIINSPRGDIVKGRDGVKELIRRGTIDYASFTREIETISIYEKTVVVMGRETVVMSAAAEQAGQTLQRRFTSVWVKRGGKWNLTARHASLIPPTN